MAGQHDAMELGEEEIKRILSLVDQFDRSGLTYLRFETRDFKLVLSKGDPPQASQEVRVPPARVDHRPVLADRRNDAGEPATREPGTAAAGASAAPEGAVPITAPMVGRFYVAPEPGAPPFVSGGSRVDEETTVGLIEVMKVFTAVKAGVRGVITHAYVEDGQFVEYGQVLFLVQTEGGAGNAP